MTAKTPPTVPLCDTQLGGTVCVAYINEGGIFSIYRYPEAILKRTFMHLNFRGGEYEDDDAVGQRELLNTHPKRVSAFEVLQYFNTQPKEGDCARTDPKSSPATCPFRKAYIRAWNEFEADYEAEEVADGLTSCVIGDGATPFTMFIFSYHLTDERWAPSLPARIE